MRCSTLARARSTSPWGSSSRFVTMLASKRARRSAGLISSSAAAVTTFSGASACYISPRCRSPTKTQWTSTPTASSAGRRRRDLIDHDRSETTGDRVHGHQSGDPWPRPRDLALTRNRSFDVAADTWQRASISPKRSPHEARTDSEQTASTFSTAAAKPPGKPFSTSVPTSSRGSRINPARTALGLSSERPRRDRADRQPRVVS